MPTPLLMLFVAAAYGASTALIAAALGHFPPWTLAALRAALALPFLLLLAGASGRQKRPDRHDLVTILVGGTLVVSIPFVTLAAGLQHITSGMGGMLLASMPLFTLALAPLFQRDEPPHFDQGLRLGAGVFGVALMAIPGLLGQGFAQAGQATLLTLLAPLSYAAGNIWFRRRRRVAPLILTAAIFAVGAATLWPMALLIDGPVAIGDPAAALPLLLGLVLVGTLAPLVLNFVLLERGAAREAGLALLLMPLFSLGFGAWFLGESLSVLGLVGLALVIAGASWRVPGLRRARAALPAEVQGLMRSTVSRATPVVASPAAKLAEAAPETPARKLTPEERAARRAERQAERRLAQRADAAADHSAQTPDAGQGARNAGSRVVIGGAAGGRDAPSAMPRPAEGPKADGARLTPEQRAARRAARRAERQKALSAERQPDQPVAQEQGRAIEQAAAPSAPRDAAEPRPEGAGDVPPGEKTGPGAERQAARKAARLAARQAGKAALHDN